MFGSAVQPPSSARIAGGLTLRQLFGIAMLFWTYVTLSNLIYGYAMRVTVAQITSLPLFASWEERLLQHVLLLPLLLVTFWASLRIQWRPLLVAAPLQLILCVAFAACAYPAMVIATVILGHDAPPDFGSGSPSMGQFVHSLLPSLWLATFASFLPAYGFGLALVTGLALYTRVKDSELRLTALARESSAARLAALRMQLSPHTLFNLLHTIRGEIDWNPKEAQSMVVQLADLLRRLLSAGERDLSPLQDELHFARLYLELQQRRFADRLEVQLPRAESVPAVLVPSLILQPLIENAVVHGLAGHQGPVIIAVTVSERQGSVTIQVRNSIAAGRAKGGAGIGLKNVRERIAVQFNGSAALEAGLSGEAWVSELRIPALHAVPDGLAA